MKVSELIDLLEQEDQDMEVVFTVYDDNDREFAVEIEDVCTNCMTEDRYIMCLDENGVTEEDLDHTPEVVVLR